MSFYTFNQNNSGGFFVGPEYVIIEADSADDANMIALDHDVYFITVTIASVAVIAGMK